MRGSEAFTCGSTTLNLLLFAKGTLLRYSATEQQTQRQTDRERRTERRRKHYWCQKQLPDIFLGLQVKKSHHCSSWMSLWGCYFIVRWRRNLKKLKQNTESAASSSSNQSSVMGNAGLSVCARLKKCPSSKLPLMETFWFGGFYFVFQWHLRGCVWFLKRSKDVSSQERVMKRGICCTKSSFCFYVSSQMTVVLVDTSLLLLLLTLLFFLPPLKKT